MNRLAGILIRAASVLIAMLLVSSVASAQQGDRKVALVVGNGKYQYVPRLDNPTNDAQLMADTLKGLGFTLVGGKAQLDLDKAGFDREVQAFGAAMQGANVAVFYYAGHGLQVGGSNYLVPTSANPTKASDVDFQMIDANVVLRQMEDAGTKLNVLILDACRNNPFGGRGLRDSGGGLAQMQVPEGTLISYATQPGNVAQDGSDGHSPYTEALSRSLKVQGLDVFDVFNQTGLAVKRATGGNQQPWVASSPIEGKFYFAGLPAANAVAVTPPAPVGPSLDGAVWNMVKNATDPEQFAEYLRVYPNSEFAPEARRKLASLSSTTVPPVNKPVTPVPVGVATTNGGGTIYRGRLHQEPATSGDQAVELDIASAQIKDGKISIATDGGALSGDLVNGAGELKGWFQASQGGIVEVQMKLHQENGKVTGDGNCRTLPTTDRRNQAPTHYSACNILLSPTS